MDTTQPNRPISASGKQGTGTTEFRARYRRIWLTSVFFTAFVSLTPLVIMTLANFYQYRKSLQAEMIQPIVRLTSTSKRFIDDFLEERRAALTYVVKRESCEDLCDPAKLNGIFRDMKESFGGLVDLGVIDSEGKQQSYVGRYHLEGKDYSEQEWFHEVCIRGVHVSDVFQGYRHLPHFVIAVRQDGDGDEELHILRATIDSEVFSRYIASLDLRPSSDAFLINREGILQTPSRHEGRVLEPCSIPVPPARLNPQIMEEVINKQGEPRILGYAYIERTPFIFVVLKHPQDVMQSWLLLRSDILWLLGVGIAMILTVVLWGSTYLVNRVREADSRRDKALYGLAYTNKMASIGRMAAGVAHEINNPLAIINENAGLLKDLIVLEDRPLDRDRLGYIAAAVLKSVERCSTITHRLLGFAKRMAPRVEPIELRALLEEVLSFQGKEADYRSIRVKLEAPKDLLPIVSDRGLLQQVFLNILSNAFAAVDDGGRIDISIKQDGDMVAVAISDDGRGIPEEHIDRIFDPFFTTKTEYGTGLGLSITFGIVEKLGGRINCRSEVGKGTTFTVRLPLTRA